VDAAPECSRVDGKASAMFHFGNARSGAPGKVNQLSKPVSSSVRPLPSFVHTGETSAFLHRANIPVWELEALADMRP
jgi:hypothetical protein